MANQCPGCFRLFSSQRYLGSHLQQSACSSLLGNVGMVSLVSSTPNLGTDIVLAGGTNSSTAPPAPPADDRTCDTVPTIQPAFQASPPNALADNLDRDDWSFPLNNPDTDADTAGSLSTTSTPITGSPHMGGTATTVINNDVPSTGSKGQATLTKIRPNESLNVPAFSDDRLIPMIKLMSAVRQAGAPLNLVDSLVKILKEEHKFGRLEMTNLCTNRTAIRRIQKLFPSLPQPSSVTITHERTSHEMSIGADRPSVTFPVFSFLGQLEDLLNDHLFSDLTNLVLDPMNRWEHYQRNSCPHASHEIQDGNWFQGIVQQISNETPNPDIKDFIIGVQGYVDKTGTDAYQRASVEPLVITLTLFTNSVQNSSSNWRVLALLPSSIYQKQKKKHAFGASVRNYHTALNAALEEFIHLQKNPPTIRLRLGDEIQYVRARLVWVNTIADGLANEQLVGRIRNRVSSPRLSRACHCPQHLADSTNFHCNFVRQSAIQHLVVAALGPLPDNPEWSNYLNQLSTNQEKRLAESCLQNRKKMAQSILKDVFGQHVVDLVWFHVDQGPNPRGCFGSTSVDPMHAFEEGIVLNILSVILDPLPDSVKSNLDALALSIVSNNRWDEEYPRLNFSGGFCSITQLTADEKVGKLLLLWIALQTPKGRQLLEKRCDRSFDAQRNKVTARFSGQKTVENDTVSSDDEEGESGSESVYGSTGLKFTGSLLQKSLVKEQLKDHGLQFIVPWIDQMIPFHQDLLYKAVLVICGTKGGREKRHILPPNVGFLDRYVVDSDISHLYCEEGNECNQVEDVEHDQALYSIDCTVDELLTLLDMLLWLLPCHLQVWNYSRENQL